MFLMATPEYVLKKDYVRFQNDYTKFKEEVNKKFHDNELDKSRMQVQIDHTSEDVKKILENSEWMKRVWIKAIVSMVCSVIGSVLIGIGALIWYLVKN